MEFKLSFPKEWTKGPSSSLYSRRSNLTHVLVYRLTVGSSVRMRGTLVDSPSKGQSKEFRAASVELVGESDAEVSFSTPRPTPRDFGS